MRIKIVSPIFQRPEREFGEFVSQDELVEFDDDGFRNFNWKEVDGLFINDEQLENCKVFSSREKILEVLPKNGVCAELGVANGDLSYQILDINKPKKLILGSTGIILFKPNIKILIPFYLQMISTCTPRNL